MRVEFHNPAKTRLYREGPSALIPFALLATCVPLGVWTLVSLLASGGPQTAFVAEAGWFAILALVYLSLHGLRGAAWVSVPVLLTIKALVQFLFIPLLRFAAGDDQLDAGYTHAMFLVLIGFAAFWIGSLVVKRESGLQFVPRFRDTPARVTFISASMLALGLVADLTLWKAHLFGYATDSISRESSFGFLEWLHYLANLLPTALVITSIEVLGKRSKQPPIRSVFWLSLLFSIGIGVMSGMKSGAMDPLIVITIIYAITNRRVPRTALFLPLILVVLIFPFVNAYRDNLNHGYKDQFNTIGGMEATFVQSFDDAFLTFGSSSSEARAESFREATGRLSYLNYVRDIAELPDPSMLSGDEKVWMAPFYPLVPRFLWKGKPILNKGQRLNIVLGRGSESSSALTPIGDLNSMYGTYGVVAGMLAWGIFLQLFMNWIGRGGASETRLFVFMTMLGIFLNFEDDVFSLVANTVQLCIVVMIMSYVIYGQPASSTRIARNLVSSGMK